MSKKTALAPQQPAKPLARRVELTPEMITAYVQALDYMPASMAANALGVSARTVYSWLQEGEDPECTDVMKRELFEQSAKIQGNGQRKKLMKILWEQAEVDPAAAERLAKMLIPGLVPSSKVEVSHTSYKAESSVRYDLATPEELDVLQAAEEIKELLLKRAGQ